MAEMKNPAVIKEWATALHRDAVHVLNAVNEADLLGAQINARHARTHAGLVAHSLSVEPGEVPTAQMEKILEFLAARLAEEGEPLAADLLRDEEVRRDALIEFSGEEPRGAGADPYGRPSPTTHPEYWTE